MHVLFLIATTSWHRNLCSPSCFAPFLTIWEFHKSRLDIMSEMCGWISANFYVSSNCAHRDFVTEEIETTFTGGMENMMYWILKFISLNDSPPQWQQFQAENLGKTPHGASSHNVCLTLSQAGHAELCPINVITLHWQAVHRLRSRRPNVRRLGFLYLLGLRRVLAVVHMKLSPWLSTTPWNSTNPTRWQVLKLAKLMSGTYTKPT